MAARLVPARPTGGPPADRLYAALAGRLVPTEADLPHGSDSAAAADGSEAAGAEQRPAAAEESGELWCSVLPPAGAAAGFANSNFGAPSCWERFGNFDDDDLWPGASPKALCVCSVRVFVCLRPSA